VDYTFEQATTNRPLPMKEIYQTGIPHCTLNIRLISTHMHAHTVTERERERI
jgi:hypothetical protein